MSPDRKLALEILAQVSAAEELSVSGVYTALTLAVAGVIMSSTPPDKLSHMADVFAGGLKVAMKGLESTFVPPARG